MFHFILPLFFIFQKKKKKQTNKQTLLFCNLCSVAEMSKRADDRSNALYSFIDNSGGFYSAPVAKDARSRMNVVFRIKDKDAALEKKFVAEAEARKLHTLKGHRSVGGLRASLYNAMPMDGVLALLAFMKEFQEANQ